MTLRLTLRCCAAAIVGLFIQAATPVNAAQQCNPNGLCNYFIPPDKLPHIQAQQTMVWCWAASAQAIFRYYGHDVPQPVIVAEGIWRGGPERWSARYYY
jgi:hypothetical protein